MFFKKPYIDVILKWSIFIYVIPAILRIISFKIERMPFWIHAFYMYIIMFSALMWIYLVMYLIELWDINNSKMTHNKA